MTLDPFQLMTILVIAAFGFVSLILSPLFIELIKPKDKGPRKIPRMPLEKLLRTSKTPRNTNPSKTETTDHSSNLQDILKEAGAKSTRIGKDIVRISGDFVFPAQSEIQDNVVIEGTVKIGDDCVFHQSIKAEGNAAVGNRVVIKGNLVSNGDVKLLDEVVIGGSLHSDGSVTIGEKVFVSLSVVAIGDVELYENSEVKNNILTRGTIRVLRPPRVDFPSSIDNIG